MPRVAYAHELCRRGDFDRAEALLAEERELAVRLGDEWLVVRLDIFSSDLALRRGAWDEAERLLATALGEVRDYWRAIALARRAVLRGRRGDPAALDDVRDVRESPFATADPVIGATVEHAVDLLDLAAGRTASAARLLQLPDLLDAAGARGAEIEAAIPEIVLALVEAGLVGDAERLTQMLERLARRSRDAWRVPAAAYCRGLILLAAGEAEASLRPLGVARSGFEAIAVPGSSDTRCWRRVAPCDGSGGEPTRPRRSRRRNEASPVCAPNRGARGRRTSSGARGRARGATTRSTAAESRVARLVAGGRTNKEAAAELFTSVATVEAHLTRIYRKLELRSRTELTRAVADGRVELDGDAR